MNPCFTGTQALEVCPREKAGLAFRAAVADLPLALSGHTHCLPGPSGCPGPQVQVKGEAEAAGLGAGQWQAAWTKHSRLLSPDPVVASLSQDVFKELSQIEACQGPMQTRLIPTLVSIMQAPADKIPAGLCAVRPRPYSPAPPLTSRDVLLGPGCPWAQKGGASQGELTGA